MPRPRTNHNLPLGPIAGIAIALFAAGGAAAWFAINQISPSSRSTVTPNPVASPEIPSPNASLPPSVSPPQSASPIAVEPSPPRKPILQTRQVYWLKVTDTKSELVPQNIEIQKSNNPAKELDQIFTILLSGPIDSSNITTIPARTKLLGLKEDKKGIRVNLSQEFATDDGADLLIGRLAQVLYTATSLDPNAKVWIQVEGQPLELLGEGHGLEIAQPMTRKFFEENYQLSAN